MGFYASLRQPAAFRAETPSRSASIGADFWYTPEGWVSGSTGGAELALTLSPLWKGVRILSENIASFQATVHERLDRGNRKLSRHALSWSLGRQPTTSMNAFEFWETAMVHLVLRGKAFAFRRWVPKRSPALEGLAGIDLVPIHPDRVIRIVRRPGGELEYQIRDDTGQTVPYGSSDILHLRGMSADGINGLAMTTYASKSIMTMLAAETFSQRFFTQGALAAVAAIPERDIGPEGVKGLTASVRQYLTGLQNAHGVFVPPDKITLQTIGVDPEKAQLLATRQFSTEQFAHWLNLPPGMLGDSKTPTFASSQQFRQDLVDLCFRPWTERLEAKMDIDVLQYADENPLRYYLKFEMDSLLRGNAKERAAIHESGIRAGYKTRNEARLDEELEPLDGLDEPIFALNMGSRGSGQEDPSQARLTRATMVTMQEASVLVRKEIAAASKAATRFASDGAGWQAWLREFYGQHGREVAERLRLPVPVGQEYAARQGMRLAARGVKVLEDWEQTVVAELVDLALNPPREAAYSAVEENVA